MEAEFRILSGLPDSGPPWPAAWRSGLKGRGGSISREGLTWKNGNVRRDGVTGGLSWSDRLARNITSDTRTSTSAASKISTTSASSSTTSRRWRGSETIALRRGTELRKGRGWTIRDKAMTSTTASTHSLSETGHGYQQMAKTRLA